ncbi:MAG: porin [Planctomycetes bacterium]|nr:porin [Planctomycetota bacterium]
MSNRLLKSSLVTVAWASSASLSLAQSSTPAESHWYDDITINGFAEVSWSHDFNSPDSGTNALRVFDLDDDEVDVDAAELVIQRPIGTPGELGFRVDAVTGTHVPKVSAASGLFRDSDTGEAHDFDLQQVLGSWIAPVGSGLRLDVGKFVTPFGYEVIEGYDGYNDNQSRGFLFGYGMPFTHTGLRAGYTFSESVGASLLLVQGWDNWTDNNDAKSIGVQFALTPAPDWTVYLNALGGPEQADDSHDNRYLYGATGTWRASETVTVGIDTLYGTEEGVLSGGKSASWSGGAGYCRYRFSDTFALALRGELFDDSDGARTGTAQTLESLTLTPEWKLGEHCVLRGDLRGDWSDEDVFEDHSSVTGSRTTVSLALLVLF